jgi:hypothetical protein
MRSRSGDNLRDPNQLDRLIQEITVDAYGDDEKLWAFRQALEDELTVPCDGYVIGEPVCISAFDYSAEDAIRHYQVGVDIGELSLPAGFDGLLLWGHVNNRPFLRFLIQEVRAERAWTA